MLKILDPIALVLGLASAPAGGIVAWLVWFGVLPGVYALGAVALWCICWLLLCGWLGWRNPFSRA